MGGSCKTLKLRWRGARGHLFLGWAASLGEGAVPLLGASFWMSMLPFKCAPSSMEMRWVVMSPTTVADCFKSTRSLA